MEQHAKKNPTLTTPTSQKPTSKPSSAKQSVSNVQAKVKPSVPNISIKPSVPVSPGPGANLKPIGINDSVSVEPTANSSHSVVASPNVTTSPKPAVIARPNVTASASPKPAVTASPTDMNVKSAAGDAKGAKMVGGRLQNLIKTEGQKPQVNASVMTIAASDENVNQSCMPWANANSDSKKLLSHLLSIRLEVQQMYKSVQGIIGWETQPKCADNFFPGENYTALKLWMIIFTAKDVSNEIVKVCKSIASASILGGKSATATRAKVKSVPTKQPHKRRKSIRVQGPKYNYNTEVEDMKESPLAFLNDGLDAALMAVEDMGVTINRCRRSILKLKEEFDALISVAEEKEEKCEFKTNQLDNFNLQTPDKWTVCTEHTVPQLHRSYRPGAKPVPTPEAKERGAVSNFTLFGRLNNAFAALLSAFKEITAVFKRTKKELEKLDDLLDSVCSFGTIQALFWRWTKSVKPALSWFKKYQKKVLGNNALPSEQEKYTRDQVWDHIVYIITKGLVIVKEVSEMVFILRMGYMLLKGSAMYLDPNSELNNFNSYEEVMERNFAKKYKQNTLVSWVPITKEDFYSCPYPETLRRVPVVLNSKNLQLGIFEYNNEDGGGPNF